MNHLYQSSVINCKQIVRNLFIYNKKNKIALKRNYLIIYIKRKISWFGLI